MERKVVSEIMFTSLLIGMLTLPFCIQSVKAGTIIVPDDYPTIQEAINAASDEDTIFVRNGTYYENVVVNRSVSLIGENRDTAVIDGKRSGIVVEVTVSNVSIKNFTIRGGSSNIWISYCSNVSISNSNVKNAGATGIMVTHSSTICVSHNTIENNSGWGGIYVSDSSNVLIHKNNATNNGEYSGIHISGSSNVLILDNKANNNGFGIRLTRSTSWRDNQNVSIIGNDANFNQQTGISIHNCHNCSVLGNNANDNNNYINAAGIGVYSSPNCLISKNNATGNYIGIYVSSSNCSVSRNNALGNYYNDIKVTASGNKIFNNNLGKAVVSSSALINAWDDGYPSGGNYWSDYTGVDEESGSDQDQPGSDGIGDTVHEIDADNRDRYPLMAPINIFEAGTWNETEYFVDIVSNSTVSDFYFNPDEGAFLRFNVTGDDGTVGFCRITIPNDLLWVDDGWAITVGDQPITNYTLIPNGNYTYLYFTYNHSTQTVTIQGTNVIPEFPSYIALLGLLMLITISLTFAKKKRFKKAKT